MLHIIVNLMRVNHLASVEKSVFGEEYGRSSP